MRLRSLATALFASTLFAAAGCGSSSGDETDVRVTACAPGAKTAAIGSAEAAAAEGASAERCVDTHGNVVIIIAVASESPSLSIAAH